MAFKVNRKSLAAELALLAVTAEKKTTMPILSTVKFVFTGNTLTLTGTDIDMAIITQVEASGESWAGCVPSKQLYELVRLFNGEEIEFAPQPNERIKIKWGKASHRLPVFPVTEFPEVSIASVEMVKMDGAVLGKAIGRALRCTSTDAREFWMQGISLRSRDGMLTVFGTNNRHFAATEITTPWAADILLPLRASGALVRFLAEGESEVGANQNQAVFRQGSRVFLTRLMDAKFPDWRPLIPADFKHSVVLDATVAQQALRLAAVTAKEHALIPIPLRVTLSSNEMLVETHETDMGQSTEPIPISCPTMNGDSLTIGVNGTHFISFMEAETNPLMSFNDDLRMFQFTPEGETGYRYFTMTLKA
jgi:DNA polymerase-3 subunit beta